MLPLFDGPNWAAETLRFIEQQGRCGLWRMELPSREMKWSRGVYDLLGVAEGELQASQSGLQSRMHPDDTWMPSDMDRILGEAGVVRREFRIIQPNGRVRWIASRGEVLLDEFGRPDRAIGILLDVTDHQRYRNAADVLAQRFHIIASVLGHVVWVAAPDGLIDAPGWERRTGQSCAEYGRMDWLNAIHPDDRSQLLAKRGEEMSKKIPFTAEFRVRHRDGSLRWMRCQSAPVLEGDGSVREWVGIMVDINAEKVWHSVVRTTGAQIRAGRALLNWSVRELADCSRVSISIVRRIEETNRNLDVTDKSVSAVRNALEKNGIEFILAPGEKPGVCYR